MAAAAATAIVFAGLAFAVPGPPTNLALENGSPPHIQWNDMNASSYKVYKAGSLYVTLSGSKQDWQDSVTPSSCTTYGVSQVVSGVEGTQATINYPAGCTTIATPAAPTATTPTNAKPVLSWSAVSGASTYKVYRGATLLTTTASLTYTDSALAADGTYSYTLKAVDANGGVTSASPALSVTYDTTAPGTPGAPTGSSPTNTSPVLSWSSVATAATYQVYRSGTLITTTASLTYTDSALVAEGTYAYTVAAVDAASNASAQGASLSVTYDVTPPAVPDAPTGTTPTNAKPVLSWSAVSGASTYKVYRAGTLITTTASLTFTDSALVAEGTYAYTIAAVDAASNASAQGSSLSVTYDTTAPGTPGAPTGSSPTNTSPVLSWSSVATAATYKVYRSGTLVTTTASLTFTDSALVAEGTYAYTVAAVDAASNASAQGSSLSVTYDTTAPAVPGAPTGSSPTNTSPVLSWSSVATAATYQVSRDGSLITTTASLTYTDSALVAEGTYAYTVAAVDAASNASAQGASLSVTYDTTPPAVPGAPTGTTPTNAKPALSWSSVATAATYKLYRDATLVTTTAGTSYTDSGLGADGTYAYTLVAVDAAGNASAAGAALSVTYDTTPPAVPSAPTGTTPTNTAPALSWSVVAEAATYRVYRDGTLITTTAGTSYTDGGLGTDGAYAYTLVAVDALGNASAAGAATSIAYDTTPPATPSAPSALRAATNTNPALYFAAVSGVASYLLYRDGTLIATLGAVPTSGSPYVDSGASSDGSYAYTVAEADAAGNLSSLSAARVVVVDQVAPGAPTITAADSPTNAAPSLGWDAASDDSSGIASYAVYRDGSLVGTVADPGTTFVDSGAAEGSHAYEVIATDEAGNAGSAATTTIVLDTTAPDAPTFLTAPSPTNAKPALSWSGVIDAARYIVRRGATTLSSNVTTTSFTDAALTAEGSSSYTVAAVDAAGNVSADSSAVAVVYDVTPPAVPADLAGPALTRLHPHLTWTAVPDGDAASYTVYRDGTAAGSSATASFDDTTLAAEGAHDYTVTATDAAGNESAASDAASVTYDVTAPGVPTGLTAASPTRAAPSLTWSDVSGADSYRIYRDGSLVGTSGTAAYADTALSSDGTYDYTVTALDAAGNESAASSPRTVVYDATPPSPPIGLTATTPTDASPVLTWDATAGATSYRVTRDGTTVGTVSTTTFTDADLIDSLGSPPPPVSSFDYAVVAIDAAGNVSTASDPFTVVVDLSNTSVPALLTGASPTNAVPALTWQAASGAAHYVVYRDGSAIDTTTDTSWSDSGLSGDGAYGYSVSSVNGHGLESTRSSTVTIVYDTTAPDPPTGLAAPSPTNAAPALTWDAVGDAVAYRLYRGSSLVTETGSLSATDDPTPSDGDHAYKISAVDAAGNESARSGAFTVTVLTVPPDAPTGLVADSPTASAPSLSWTATAGAVSYLVYRGGSAVGSPTTPAFVEGPGLADGTYGYTVVAVDAAGNQSDPSSTRTVVLDTVAPDAPDAPSAPNPSSAPPTLTWSGPSDAASYEVLRDGDPVGTSATTSFDDTGVTGEGHHTYAIVAIDAAGNRSASSPTFDLVLDSVPPAAPTGLAAVSPTRYDPALSWEVVSDALHYDVLRNGVTIGSTASTGYTDAALPGDGSYTYAVVAVDAAGNESSPSATVTVVADTTAPAAPSGLSATTPTDTYPALGWAAVSDAVDYVIYESGVEVGRSNTTAFTDHAVTANGTFSYTVTAIDAAGNEGAPSDQLSVVVDAAPAGVPGFLDADTPTASDPALHWNPVSGESVVYTVYRDGSVIATTAATTYSDHGLADGTYEYAVSAKPAIGAGSARSSSITVVFDTTAPDAPVLSGTTPTRADPAFSWPAVSGAVSYTVARDGTTLATQSTTSFVDLTASEGTVSYTVTATDAAGNVSAPSDPLTIVYDLTPPAAPTDLAGDSPALQADLTWSAVPGASGYRVYRDGTLVASPGTPASSATPVPGDGTYGFRVTALDEAGNESDPSDEAVIEVDTTAPDAPTVTAAANPTRVAPALSWPAVAGASTYTVKRDGIVVASSSSTTFTEGSIPSDGDYTYRVRAADAVGNVSGLSDPVVVTVDTAAPAAPTGLVAPTPTQDVSATWDADPDAATYHVFLDGALEATVSVSSVALGAFSDGSHLLAVSSLDEAGNESGRSDQTVVVDRTAPDAPTGLAGASPVNHAPAISWDAVSDAASYIVLRDGAQVGTATSEAFTDGVPPASGSFDYQVEAVDAAGNISAQSATVTIVFDIVAPAAPVGLAADATPTSAAPALGWTAVGDAAHYRVYRDGGLVAEVTTTSATDPGAVTQGTHSYRVTAVDAAGNESAQSDAVDIVVDTVAPSTPADLAADASPTRNAPGLTFSSVSDAVAYRIYRDGSRIAEQAGTSFSDGASLADGTYDYAVSAVDEAGNESPRSSVVAIELDTTAPDAPATPTGTTPTANAPSLSWGAVSDAASYVVVRDGSRVATTATASFLDTDTLADGAHTYAVLAVDAAGNESASSPAKTIVLKAAPAGTPGGLAAPSPTNGDPALSWDATADAVRYVIYRDTVEIARIDATATPTFVDTTASEGDHHYAVAGIDSVDHLSTPSDPVDVTVDRTAPDPPDVVAAPLTNAAPAGSWSAVAGASAYAVARRTTLSTGAASVQSGPTTSFTDGDALPDDTYTYDVTAIDAAGNVSDPATVTVTLDTTAPDVPDGLVATTPTRSDPAISWDPVAGAVTYVLLREGVEVERGSAAHATDETGPSDGTYRYTVRAIDAAGNTSASSSPISVEVDRTPPAAPTGLAASANPTNTEPELSWDAVSDAVSYTVERDGSPAGSLAGTAWTDHSGSGTATYAIRAVDAAGNVSDPSASLEVVVDTTPPGDLLDLAASSPAQDADLSWSAAADAAAYVVERDGSTVATVTTTTTHDHASEGAHSYTVHAVDAAGNAGASATVAVTIDRTAPDAPTGLVSPALTRLGFTVEWDAVSDAASYVLSDGGVDVATTAGTSHAVATGVLADGDHAFAVRAVDAAGNASAPSDPTTTAVDTTPPDGPVALSGSTPTRSLPAISWDDPGGTDGFVVERDGVEVARGSATSYSEGALPDVGWHTYAVASLDAAGNRSAAATLAIKLLAPVPVPAIAADQTVTRVPPRLLIDSGGFFTAYHASDTGCGVDAVQIELSRDGSTVGAVGAVGGGAASTSFDDDSPLPATGLHDYRARVVDGCGAPSDWSDPVAIRLLDSTPASPTLAGGGLTALQPVLSWDAIPDVTGYELSRDGVVVATTTDTSYTDAVADGTYRYTVVALDGGIASPPSNAVDVTVDTTPPATPTGLSGPALTSAAPALSWDAVGDATSYVLYRSGSLVYQGSDRGFDDASAPDGTLHYAVAAVDAAGNVSDPSDVVDVVRDTVAPDAPTGLAGVSPTAVPVSLSWNAVTDPAGVVYVVARDGDVIATTASTSLADTDAADGDRSYTVRARDGAGNLSAPSGALTVTVDSTAPAPPDAPVATEAITAGSPSLAIGAAPAASHLVLQRDGSDLATVDEDSSYVDGSAGEGAHSYTLVAVDDAGNRSAPSTSASVTVDRTAPSAPTIVIADDPSYDLVDLTVSGGESGLAFRVDRDGTPIQAAGAGSLSDTPPVGNVTYTAYAIDLAGNVSSSSDPVTVEVRALPSGGVAGLAATVTGADVALSFSATAGAHGYVVYRDGNEIGRPTATHLSDDGLADGSYRYTVVALLNHGQTGPPSEVDATVDTVAPDAPTSLTATTPTSGAPTLSWVGPGDAAGYEVVTDGGAPEGVPAAGFVDSGATEGTHHYAVRSVDAAGNRSAAVSIDVVVDRTAPDAPAGAAADATPTNQSPSLTWDPVSDAAGYDLLRDGVVVASSASASATDTAIAVDGSYDYTVIAIDAAGNRSAPSAPVTVERDTVAPAVVTGLAAAASPTRLAPDLSWDAADGAGRYRVLRDGVQVALRTTTSFVDSGADDGAHAYTIVAVDLAGNAAAASDPTTVILDTVPPDVPDLTALRSPTNAAPQLSWTAAGGATHYRLLRDATPVADVPGTSLTDAVPGDGRYTYRVEALDDAGNSAFSAPVDVVVKSAAPGVPDGLAAATPTNADPQLTWNGVTGSTGYTVYRDGVAIATTTSPEYVDGSAVDASYVYAVSALDDAGNESATSGAVTVVVDTVPPAVPTDLAAAASPTASAPSLTWNGVAGAASYQVLRDGSLVGTVAGSTYVDSASLADATYTYSVVAVDGAGNTSASSDALEVVVDTAAPDVPGVLTGTTPTRAAPALTWDVVTDAASYRVYRGGHLEATVTVASFTDSTSGMADGVYDYAVTAVDAAGNESALSDPLSILRDTVAPDAPAAPSIDESPTAAAPALSWTAVDGAATYELQRDGVVIATTASLAATDAGVGADGSYVYRLVAIDASGNRSAPGATATVTVDTAGPDAPDLTRPASPTNSRPALVFAPPSDAVRVEVLRDGLVVGSTAGTTFTDNPGSDGTYNYAVVAYDAAGNASAPSAAYDVVYRTAAPGVPSGLAATSPTNDAPVVSWDAVVDAVAYDVRRDGIVIARVPTTSYGDADVGVDGTYGYDVAAVDDAGNMSAASTPLDVVVDRTAPDAPVATVAAVSAGAPELSFTAPVDAVSVLVDRDGSPIAAAGSPLVDAGAGEGHHVYRLVAVDAAGNHSSAAEVSTVVDTTAPDAPTGLAAARAATQDPPSLSWDPVGDAVTYRVFRDGSVVGSVGSPEFTDADGLTEGLYRYTVRAVDAAGNVSPDSDQVEVVVDRTAPDAPAPVADAATTTTAPALTWAAVATANRYRVSRDGTVLGTTSSTHYADHTATEGSFDYTVVALDDAGNVSGPGGPVTVVVDQTAPDAPTVTAAASPTNLQPELTWPDVTDAASYEVARDGTVVATAGASGFRDALVADGAVSYTVVAIDAAGNRSASSSPVTVVYDTTAPDAPTGLAATSPTRTSPALGWDATADATAYRILRDGVLAATVTTLTYTDVDVATDGPHTYAVVALDAAGNASAPSSQITVVFRAGAPGPVGGVRGVSPTAVAPVLTWDSTPNAQGYIVWRDGTEIGRPTDPTLTDPDLPGDGEHSYTVAAIGASGSEGDPSDPASIVVDTHPPDTTITRQPSDPSSGEVTFAFSSSEEGSTADCRIDDASFTACVSPLDVAGLSTGSHVFEVRAVDAVGNADPTPSSVSWTVDADAPDQPTLTATADASQPLGSGRGAVYVHVVAPSDAVRVVVLRDATTVLDGAAHDVTDDGLADDTRFTYTATAYDAVGNASAPVTAIATTPDRTSPVTPPAPTGSGYPLQVRWPAEDGTTFSVSRGGVVVAQSRANSLTDQDAVDTASPGAPASVVATPVGSTGLAVTWQPADDAGTGYSYTVRGDDDAGNAGLASPAAQLLATSGGVTYRVIVDGSEAARTSTTHADLSGLPAGVAHTITVIATDAAGNASDPSEPASAGEDTAPGTVSGLAARTPTNTLVALTWSATPDAVAYLVFRDGTQVARVVAPTFTEPALLTDGSYAYTVEAVGAADIASASSDPATVVVDTVAPETVILAGPSGQSRANVVFELGPTEPGIRFACQLDDAPAVACTTPWALSGLALGPHQVAIVATDAAGNVDPTPATAAFTVDSIPPAVPTLTAVADTTLAAGSSRGRVTVTAAPGAGGAVVVVTEGARVVLQSAGGTVSDDVGDGRTIVYTAVTEDGAGNSSSPVTVVVTTPDRTAPAAPDLTADDGYPATLSFSGEAGVTYVLQRDGATILTTAATSYTDVDALDHTAPAVPTGLAASNVTVRGFDLDWAAVFDGGTGHAYVLQATDAAGNTSDPSTRLVVSATSGVASYSVLIDGVEAASVSSPHVSISGLDPGSSHTVAVRAIDVAGNASSSSDDVSVQLAVSVGSPAPTARIAVRPRYTRPGSPFVLDATIVPGSGSIDQVDWRFDDAATASGAHVEHRFAHAGVHTVTLIASDNAGGVVTTTAQVVVDGQAPNIRTARRLHDGLLVIATDDLSGVARLTASWNGHRVRSLDPRTGILHLPDGKYRLRLTAVDRSGNVRIVNLKTVVDTKRPSLRIRVPLLATSATTIVKVQSNDRSRPVRVTLDGRPVRSGRVTVVTGTSHVMRAVDAVGNARTITFLIPRGSRLAGLSDPALDGARGTDLWYSGSSEDGIRLYLLQAVERRLALLGYLPSSFVPGRRFDAKPQRAVRTFQKRAGFVERGIGEKTKAALDVAIGRASRWITK